MWYMYTPDKLSDGLFMPPAFAFTLVYFATPGIAAFNYKNCMSIGMVFQLIFEQKSISTINAEKTWSLMCKFMFVQSCLQCKLLPTNSGFAYELE